MLYRNVFENRHGSPYTASHMRYPTVAMAEQQQRGRDDFAWMEYSSDDGKTWIAVETRAVIGKIGPVLGTASAAPDLYRELAQELVKNEELRLARENMKQAQDAFVAQSERLRLAEQEVEKLKEAAAAASQAVAKASQLRKPIKLGCCYYGDSCFDQECGCEKPWMN
jgi:hypothetical protein